MLNAPAVMKFTALGNDLILKIYAQIYVQIINRTFVLSRQFSAQVLSLI